MVAALNAYLIPLTPREFQFQLTAGADGRAPTVTVFVARDRRRPAVGMGALKDHGGGLGEVKRMYTLPEIRGQRIGSLLLARIEALARRAGHRAPGAGDRRGAGLRAGLARLRARRLHRAAAPCSTIPIPAYSRVLRRRSLSA